MQMTKALCCHQTSHGASCRRSAICGLVVSRYHVRGGHMKQVRSWGALVVVLLLSSAAAAEPVGAGLQFLRGQQDAEGRYGAFTGEEPLVATPEALWALRSLGLGASPQAQAAEFYLALQPPALDSELELRRAAALAPTPFHFEPDQL